MDKEGARHFEALNIKVLTNLREPRKGLPYGNVITHFLQIRPDISEIWFVAPPGSGKSLLINQLTTKLEPTGFTIYPVFYDHVLSRMRMQLSETNPDLNDTINWTASHWQLLQSHFQAAIQKPVMTSPRQRSLKAVEIINPDITGRINTLLENAINHRFYPGTHRLRRLFVFIVADPRLYDFSLFMRRLVLDESIHGLKTAFLKHNIDVGPHFDDSPESDELLRNIHRHMAKATHYERLYREQNRLINEWIWSGTADRWGRRFEDYYAAVHIPFADGPLPGLERLYQVEAMRKTPRYPDEDSDVHKWIKRIAYWQYYLSGYNILSLAQGGLVTYNPISRERIFNDYSRMLISEDN